MIMLINYDDDNHDGDDGDDGGGGDNGDDNDANMWHQAAEIALVLLSIFVEEAEADQTHFADINIQQ